MPLFTLTVYDQVPAMERKASELSFIRRAVTLAVQDAQAAGGTKTSGDILNDGAVVIGSWSFNSQSAS
ncbi:hypothetical protein AB7G19_17095 [Bradyrhizobium sp. 215_C5_N1_1]|uniref:hypothetical protein n=1 Tax=unclassified Bradyrhizobium TaxID=2631580 RepID=UPI003F8BF4A4